MKWQIGGHDFKEEAWSDQVHHACKQQQDRQKPFGNHSDCRQQQMARLTTTVLTVCAKFRVDGENPSSKIGSNLAVISDARPGQ